MVKFAVAHRLVVAVASLLFFSGCSTLVAYSPQTSGPHQSLKYTQGVGTLSVKNSDQEIFMYPAFKTQGPSQPTFVIGYANNSASAEAFSPDNIKAYFRGVPVPIYSYTEKVQEIRNEKLGKQVALAILGGLAAGAAAHNASRQTYTSNYSGAVWGRGSAVRFAGSSTLRVYDPAAGMLAGAAVGGATGVGLAQLEYNAQNQERAAEAILQANTVDPQRMITGSVILKDCCDPSPRSDDSIRFEVTANGKVSEFRFRRTSGSSGGGVPQQAVTADYVPPTKPAEIVLPTTTSEAREPAPSPQSVSRPVPITVPIAPATATSTTGEFTVSAERLARMFPCGAAPKFVSKGLGFETYSMACSTGDPMILRCDAASCREMK